MEEKKVQGLNAKAAGEVTDEALNEIAGGTHSLYENELLNWQCPVCGGQYQVARWLLANFKAKHNTTECPKRLQAPKPAFKQPPKIAEP